VAGAVTSNAIIDLKKLYDICTDEESFMKGKVNKHKARAGEFEIEVGEAEDISEGIQEEEKVFESK